jgi:hypothetical protein
MADNTQFKDGANTLQTLRTRDTGSSIQAEKTDIAPWVPTSTGPGITLTVSTVSIAPTLPGGTTHVLITVQVGDVMWSEDGTAPTATSGGGWLPAGSVVEMGLAAALKFIRASTSASAATLFFAPRKYT